MSSSYSPCAACKSMRRKCTQECSFAPYFPPDQHQKFANIHKVFGACNVSKLLNELHPSQCEDAIKSLAYEAETRLLDPVYGCVGLMSMLQHRMINVQNDIACAKRELTSYIEPQAAMLPLVQQFPKIGYMPQQQHLGNPSSSVVLPQQQHPGNPFSSVVLPYNMSPKIRIPTRAPMRGGTLVIHEPQPQQHHHQYQLLKTQQELLLSYEHQQQRLQHMHLHPNQQEQELAMFNGELIDPTTVMGSSMTASGFNEMNAAISPSLTLATYENPCKIELQHGEHHGPSDHHHQLSRN